MRPVEGFPDYRITATGRVFSLRKGIFKELKPIYNKNATCQYPAVMLWSDNRQVKHQLIHLLVANSYLSPKPEGTEVNHKDGNKCNPHVDNLEWVTRKENMIHAFNHGLLPTTDRQMSTRIMLSERTRKLTYEQAVEIRKEWHEGTPITFKAIAKSHNMSANAIRNLINGKTYKLTEFHCNGTGKIVKPQFAEAVKIIEGEKK